MRRRRSAFTLTELLVTMAIAIGLVAMALPMVKFNLEEGKIREASRQVNAFLAKAKARAALTGRPAGVWLERTANQQGNRVTTMYLAEVPPLFIGAQENSRVVVNGTTLQFVTGSAPDANSEAIFNTFLTTDINNPQTTPFGIRFDYKGPVYMGLATPSGSGASLTWSFALQSPLPATPPSAAPGGYPYQFALPPRKVSDQSLELPKGTFVDLGSSGFGGGGTELSNNMGTNPVVICFSSGGSMSSIYADNLSSTPYVPQATLHLLVGRDRTENNPPAPVADPTSLWVSVGTISGAIRTADNAPISGGTLAQARDFAIRHDVRGR